MVLWRGRLDTLVTSAAASLLLINLAVHEDVGRGNWLMLFFMGGIFGSLSSLWAHVLMKRLAFYSYGASGGVWAISAAWAALTIEYGLPPLRLCL